LLCVHWNIRINKKSCDKFLVNKDIEINKKLKEYIETPDLIGFQKLLNRLGEILKEINIIINLSKELILDISKDKTYQDNRKSLIINVICSSIGLLVCVASIIAIPFLIELGMPVIIVICGFSIQGLKDLIQIIVHGINLSNLNKIDDFVNVITTIINKLEELKTKIIKHETDLNVLCNNYRLNLLADNGEIINKTKLSLNGLYKKCYDVKNEELIKNKSCIIF